MMVLYIRFISFFLLLLLIPVFAATWSNGHARYAKSIYDGNLHYSFKLVAATFVMEAIGAFFMYCEILVIQPRRRKPLIKSKSSDCYDGITNEGFSELPDLGIFPGDSNFGPTRQPDERLEDQVVGMVNARAAYEQFAFNHDEIQVGAADVAGPLTNAGASGISTEDIARRFVGITLAEPQYISSRSHDTTCESLQYTSPRKMSIDMDTTQSILPMKQSISMQNMYNNNMSVLETNPEGMMITSVSMYNLDREPAEKPYENQLKLGEKDRFSMQSWHPEKEYSTSDQYKQYDQYTSGQGMQYKPHMIDSDQYQGSSHGYAVVDRPLADIVHNASNSAYAAERSVHSPSYSLEINQQTQNNRQKDNQTIKYPTHVRSDVSQKQYQKHLTPNQGQSAPSQRKKKRKAKTAIDQMTPEEHYRGDKLKRATSHMSLMSTATSVVSGCTETEI